LSTVFESLHVSTCAVQTHKGSWEPGFAWITRPLTALVNLPTHSVQTICSDGQALAAFRTAGIDHGTATTGFHADQKPVGTGAANLGGLVSTFHGGLSISRAEFGEAHDYRNFS
jgi:hypothetical protein